MPEGDKLKVNEVLKCEASLLCMIFTIQLIVWNASITQAAKYAKGMENEPGTPITPSDMKLCSANQILNMDEVDKSDTETSDEEVE